MKIGTKIKLLWWLIVWRNLRVKRLSKKSIKEINRYPEQWKNDYILKRGKQFLKLLRVELEVKGLENVPKAPVLLVPNHSSFIDPFIVITSLENPSSEHEAINHQTVFLAKEELKKNKRAVYWLNLLSTFYIDRSKPRESLEVMDEMVAFAKKNKKSLVIFPEGTRTKDGKLGEFKGGAFRVAKKNYLPIVPVTINNAILATDKNRIKKIKVTVTYHPAIKPSKLISMDYAHIADLVKKTIAKNYIEQQPPQATTESKYA